MKREEKRTGAREGEAGRGGDECGREVGGEAVAVETLEEKRLWPRQAQSSEGDASEFPESSPPFSGALLGERVPGNRVKCQGPIASRHVDGVPSP